MGKNKDEKKSKSFLWFLGVSALSVMLLLVCQFLFKDEPLEVNRFYENTKINGINVSNMTKSQAKNIIVADLLTSKDNVEIELKYGDKSWVLSGSDFEVGDDVESQINQVMMNGRTNNSWINRKIAKQIKKDGLNINISYKNILGGFDDSVEEIIQEIEREAKNPVLEFNPENSEPFKVIHGQEGITVLRDKLFTEIDEKFTDNKKISIEIPTIKVTPEIKEEDLLKNTKLRSKFSTSYAKSSSDRKHNIKLAMDNFNGLVVQPEEVVSFNEKTGNRTADNGYKNAKIIVKGKYVDGAGGGVCQASTTLYNALVLADLKIIQANHHTLPSSYVPLSFDAMVSGDYSDLVFENNLNGPIFIKTYCDNDKVSVEIYGPEIKDGVTLKTRSEIVKVLGHNGDRIVADLKGEYDDKIIYKGEYYRLSYPKEGYETKGYIQYWKDGKIIEEKEIRHDFYQPQEGVVMEGSNDIGEGMSLPINNVYLVKPQKVNETTIENARQKFKQLNPDAYN